MNLSRFLNNGTSKTNIPVQFSSFNEDNKNIDADSLKGKFGWAFIGNEHIPYIIRSGENYCVVRMVEIKILNKWLIYFLKDLYNCTNIPSFNITVAEARLFNEINFKHCESQFGKEQFTTKDLIVRLSDAREFHNFLRYCYQKLVNTLESEIPRRCGFIRINRDSVVPYTVYNDQKYVPLFYFEGETENLKRQAVKLEGWNLSYLKFCCKVQGIRNELFAHDSCSVVSLNDVMNYFPPGTIFEDYWLKENLNSSQLLLSEAKSVSQNVRWTKKPVSPTNKAVKQPKRAFDGTTRNIHSNEKNYYVLASSRQPYYHADNSVVRANCPSTLANVVKPLTTIYNGVVRQAPPTSLLQSATMGLYRMQTRNGNKYMVVRPQSIYHLATSQDNPPPLLQDANGSISHYKIPNISSSIRPN